MKKSIALLFTIAFFASTHPSLAIFGINPTVSAIRQENREEIRDAREEAKVTLQQVRQENGQLRGTVAQERQSFWTELKKKRFEIIYKNFVRQLQKRAQIQEEARVKIQARITAKSTEGKNMTTAQTKLNTYQAISTNFQAGLVKLEAKYQALLASDKPMTGVNDLRVIVNDIRQGLATGRQILVDSIKLVIAAN